jgi:UPF0716 protein FxsA
LNGLRPVRVPGCLVGLALLLFMAMPLAELALLIWSARTIGFWWTLLACIATGIAGTMIARWQGARVMRAFQEAMMRGEMPADAVLDGAFVLVGGVLLLTPGFISDVVGFAFLLPPSRAALKWGLRRWWRRQQAVAGNVVLDADVIDATVVEPPDARHQ